MPVIYQLDSQDCFVAVNRKWSTFAAENGAPHLASQQLIGEPVWRFVDGPDVTRIYREVFWRVREQRIQVVFPFRCDSQTVRRDMLMKVLPMQNQQLEIQCITKSVVPHSFPDIQSEPLPNDPASELLRICSWCKSVNLDDRWVALEVAIKRLDLFSTDNIPQLTHTVCPDCAECVAQRER